MVLIYCSREENSIYAETIHTGVSTSLGGNLEVGKGSEGMCRYSNNAKNFRFIFLHPSGGGLQHLKKYVWVNAVLCSKLTESPRDAPTSE